MPVEEDASNAAELAQLLEILASPVRLAILRALRTPRTLSELRVRAEQARGGLNPDRYISRQGVREHLDRLILAGFVRRRPTTRHGHAVEEYLVDHARIFALTESLRETAVLAPDILWAARTEPAPPRPERGDGGGGPALVIVHGVGEGRRFPLAPEGDWIIGRRAGVGVSLEYDPFVSADHAIVRARSGRITIEDLPTSRNGTTLNWVALQKGEAAPLTPGDVVGVGRSSLVLRP